MSFLQDFIAGKGRFPTFQEIAEQLGFKSKSTVAFHLTELEKLGLIRKDSGGTICHASPSNAQDRRLKMVSVPLLGSIPASPPVETFATDDVIEVPENFTGGRKDVFALIVKGESMMGLGIHDGDTAFIQRQETASDGQIVAVRINNEVTLKTFKKRGGTLILKPANPSMAPIETRPSDDVAVMGVLVGIFHRYC